MNEILRRDAEQIIQASLRAVQPDAAVRRALGRYRSQGGRTVLVAAGKAAWQMARSAVEVLGAVDGGIVITKYGHARGEIPGVVCCEAGHPVPDENGFAATGKALELVRGFCSPAAAALFLKSPGSPPRSCGTSRGSCWPAARILWRSIPSASG